jgi:glycine/D-amino acid oxidase-like deaminating enzyme
VRRREVLGAPFLQLGRKARPPIPGGWVMDAYPLGHKLRDGVALGTARETQRVDTVIVGGGMAGLSAAWWFLKKGHSNFVLLEMEKEAGGNSRYGQNEVSAYPWGAHYVPVPNRNSPLVRELFEEVGLLRDGEWNERHLCHAPQERLFLHGRWQYGLEPEVALSAKGREQFKRWEELVAKLHATGQWTIPHALGAIDSKLEAQSFGAWLKQQGFDAPELLWYLDYSTRDDYGTALADTSAWAGLHYFAARDHDDKGPFTWPEGNGWLMRYLREKAARQTRTAAVVYRVEKKGRGWRVRTPQLDYEAKTVIWAAPSFLAGYLVEGAPRVKELTYSPWVTANLTLERMPKGASEEELAWDNVIYNSPSLGYVVATHQHVASRIRRSVWTWYYAIAEEQPDVARRNLLAAPWEAWRDRALKDLSRPHPDLADCVTRIDLFRNGHAMARPTPGFLASSGRKQLLKGMPGFWFANSDLSGISIFEEAQYRGVEAARAVLRWA